MFKGRSAFARHFCLEIRTYKPINSIIFTNRLSFGLKFPSSLLLAAAYKT